MAFDHTRSQASGLRIVANALVVPFGEGAVRGKGKGIARPAGVYDADGNYLPSGQCWRAPGLPVTVEPTGPLPDAEGKMIGGTWLYGGMLYQHFGHFLVESTSRFWGIDHLPEGIDGVLFLPKKRLNRPRRFVEPLKPLLEMFSSRFRQAEAPTGPVRVERLVLAPQGFGTGPMIAGSPDYRAFIHSSFGKAIRPEGAEKIYISRSRLFSKRGRYFGEARIEALLEAEGYRIFHPQDYSIEEQIAQYKAASKLLSSDSSALHLAAFFTGPQNRIGIVLRRPGNTVDDFLLQFDAFSGRKPDVFDKLSGRLWKFEGAKISQMSEIYAELDFPSLGAALANGGYIASDRGWSNCTAEEIEAERADLAARLGQEIVLTES